MDGRTRRKTSPLRKRTLRYDVNVKLLLITTLLLAPSMTAQKMESLTSVGQMMPSFQVTDIGGQLFDLDALRGKVVLVNFWATWCGPCRTEIPRIEEEIWKINKSDNFVVIGISREEEPEKVTKFAAEQKMTYRVAADPDRKIYKRFATAGIPRTYLVDAKGKIVYQSLGYTERDFEELKKVLTRVLSREKP